MPSVSTSPMEINTAIVKHIDVPTKNTHTRYVVGETHINPYTTNKGTGKGTGKGKGKGTRTGKRTFATQTPKEKKEPKEKEECPICLKRMGAKNRVVTKCGHTFCSTCIFTNFGKSQNGNNCPMCRTKFAPPFLSSKKHTPEQICSIANSVMQTYWQEDKRLSRPALIERRLFEQETEYEHYIEEYGYQHVPYLKLLDYIRKTFKNRPNKTELFNELHGLIDDLIVGTVSQDIASKLDAIV
jgi:hypothetical protein